MDPTSNITGDEIDLMYPDDVPSSFEPHQTGRIWAQFLWDLRDRAELLQSELPNRGIDEHFVENLDFEAMTRLGRTVGACGFGHPLQTLLDSDVGLTGGQLNYDILASAARHGIKLSTCDRGDIAAAESDRYVNDPSVGADFTIYSGSNDGFFFEVATEPELIRNSSFGDPRYAQYACIPSLGCSMDPLPRSKDRKNLSKRVHIDSTTLQRMMGGSSDPKLLFWRVTTFHINADGSLEEMTSDRPGAGFSVRDPDLPAIVLAAPGADTGCTCSVDRRDHSVTGSVGLLLIAVCAMAIRRSARV